MAMTDSERARNLVELSEQERTGDLQSTDYSRLTELRLTSDSIAQKYLMALDEIKRLQTQLQSWKDTAMASATEARLLHELAKDQDHASALLSNYPIIEFYTLQKGKKGEQWVKVYGKKIEQEGLEFGVYFDPKIMGWHVVDLVCGLSLGHVDKFENAITRVVQIVEWKGLKNSR